LTFASPPATAFANEEEEDTLPLYHLPQASFDVKKKGKIYRAYSFEAYKKLRLIDVDYERLLKLTPALEAKLKAQADIVALQQKQNSNLNIAVGNCVERLDKKHQEMMELVKPRPENWWEKNWKVVLIYVPVGIAVGFGVGYMVKDLSK
jgi:hypothetical protein